MGKERFENILRKDQIKLHPVRIPFIKTLKAFRTPATCPLPAPFENRQRRQQNREFRFPVSPATIQKNILQSVIPNENNMTTYNANVRIGNWYNELMLQEEKAKQYMRKSKNFELNVQKTRLFFKYMLREIPLTFPVVGLSYGAIIQIVSPDMPPTLNYKLEEKQGIALGVEISPEYYGKRHELDHGDMVIGTGLMTPCVRNVWTLVPDDPSLQGKELRYGDSFHIKLVGSSSPLYLECLLPTPSTPKGESGHVTPKLVNDISTLTRFKVVSIDPSIRFETQGATVPSFEKVAIIQACSSESLAVEPDTWFPTYFGMECEVSVHTYKSSGNSKSPDPRNYWCFILAR